MTKPVFTVEGHAIVCDNGCIADQDGVMPEGLKNPADWAYFQTHLDTAAIVITGRLGHEAHPNKPGRQRLVFTRSAGKGGFRREDDVAFLDPDEHDLIKAFHTIAPRGGIVAVTGGTGIFDWFAERRLFYAFHLARARGFRIAKGRPLFSATAQAEDHLATIGLTLREQRMLDEKNRIELLRFAR